MVLKIDFPCSNHWGEKIFWQKIKIILSKKPVQKCDFWTLDEEDNFFFKKYW